MSYQLQIFEADRGRYVDRASCADDADPETLAKYARDTLEASAWRIVTTARDKPLPLQFAVPAWQRTPKRARVPMTSPEDMAVRASDYYWSLYMPSRYRDHGERVTVRYWEPGKGAGSGIARRYLETLRRKLNRQPWVNWIAMDPDAPGGPFGPDDVVSI